MQSPTIRSLTLDKLKQLVDINGDLTNFRAHVEISPKEVGVYEVAIVNQTILDNSEEFKYSVQKGPYQYSFDVVDGIYQNYFLCLKAASPLDVDVSVSAEKLASKTVENIPSHSMPNPVTMATVEEQSQMPRMMPQISEKFYHQTWFKILVGFLVISIGIWAYRHYSSVQPKKSVSIVDMPVEYNFGIQSPPVLESSRVSVATQHVAEPAIIFHPDLNSVMPIQPVVNQAVVAHSSPMIAPMLPVLPPALSEVSEETVPVLPDFPRKSVNDFTSKLLAKLRHNSNRM